MPFIYAMSDIHGHLDIFKDTLQSIDLKSSDNKLILLGDYINRGNQSCETIYFVKELSEKYLNQVIVLRGNHEDMFLEQLAYRGRMYAGDSYNEMQNYLSDSELNAIERKCSSLYSISDIVDASYKEMVSMIKVRHKKLIDWISKLPYYYETESQIFVHAGIDEEAKEYWKYNKNDFAWKYPHVTGRFYKDIIAGHISTAEIAGDTNYHKVFWDGQSHYYIDGETLVSKMIPILKYNTRTKEYTSFEKCTSENGAVCERISNKVGV